MSIKKEQEIVPFFILFSGDIMVFIKGFIVGIGKIIPGVSGAMLAINFKIYERLLDSITNFFGNWKNNIKFLFLFCLGLIISIVLFSNVILYLLNNYKFIMMMFFVGLITGGTYNFSKEIEYNMKSIFLIAFISLLMILFTFSNNNNSYIIKGDFSDNIIFFIGGIIEIFASIVPGISGTSLLMLIGIYNEVLIMISNALNLQYVINHFNIYLSYGIGMFISFIINSYLISYLLKKYRNITNCVILALSISSIIFLLKITFDVNFYLIEFIIGLMLLVLGILLSCILDK